MNIDLLIAFLKDKGRFTLSSEPIHILNIDFVFDAVFIGPENQNGLLLVHELKSLSTVAIQKKLLAFSMALERTDSLRTVTLLLVTNGLEVLDVSELSKLCRVLILKDLAPFEEALSSILPLELPPPISSTDSADVALKKELSDDVAIPLIQKLLKAARQSESEVQKEMREAIDEIAKVPSSV